MNENFDILKIITDYFSGEISESDSEILNDWLKIPANKKEFKAYAKANYLSGLEPYTEQVTGGKYIKLLTGNLYKIAAVFLILLSVAAIWKFTRENSGSPSSEFISVAVNGNYSSIKDFKKHQFINDKNKKPLATFENGILRLNKNPNSNKLIINVPIGKNLKVLLTDGTEVLLNAATQLAFNSDFVQKNSREVSLKGEAFFHVSKDAAHPFYVNTDHFTTKVLGTKFNISSYNDENKSFVNLVEGKIEVSGNKTADKKILVPGEKISFSPSNKIVQVEEANPYLDMDWLHKEIAFDNNTTEEVLSKIERVYGLQIVRKNVTLEDSHFSGTFKIENLDQITNSLEILLNCKIQKEGNKLILKSN